MQFQFTWEKLDYFNISFGNFFKNKFLSYKNMKF